MIICPKCGNQLSDGVRFCSFCGSSITHLQPQSVVHNNIQIPAPQTSKKKKSSKKIVAVIIAVLLVIAIAIGGWFFWNYISEKNLSAGADKNSTEVENIKDETINNNKPISCDIAERVKNANNGDIVEFGSYPQSLVTDSEAISLLDSQTFEWISYKYIYPDTRNVEADFMKYADIDIDKDGDYDYRAVTFSEYRSRYAIDYDSTPVSYQNDNGYSVNQIYYFKYEPVKWRILDKESGLIVSEELIDAQYYNKYFYWTGGMYQNKTGNVNSWEISDIRAWLNDYFCNLVFNEVERDCISISTIENKSYDGAYNYADTEDKIFLLSYEDMLNSAYGFGADDSADDARVMNNHGTDYAKCQGLGGGKYFLRSAGFGKQSDSIVSVCRDGSIDYGAYSHSWDNYGIRPALKIAM